jgi:Domain of unknown function (DUF397)
MTSDAGWTKSSWSGTQGDCVEISVWTKSSWSSPDGECVEVRVVDSADAA